MVAVKQGGTARNALVPIEWDEGIFIGLIGLLVGHIQLVQMF